MNFVIYSDEVIFHDTDTVLKTDKLSEGRNGVLVKKWVWLETWKNASNLSGNVEEGK